MNGTTIWWQSKTVWGSVVAMAAGAAQVAGIDISQPIQTELTDIIVGIGTLAGGALALYGRVRAVTQLIWAKP